ncbi:MAG: hypothetical protein FJ096_19855 [Deltaproteobacteria bacterium]|nr:hypothetical protein [Deltaproteobacteria bacterium]
MLSAQEVRASLFRADAPAPLDDAIYDALGAEGVDGRHGRIVDTWELALQIAATSAWAVCRHLGLRSADLDEILPKLRRASIGQWLEVLRVTRGLLARRQEAAAIHLAPLLEGLDRPFDDDARLTALAQRIRELPVGSSS